MHRAFKEHVAGERTRPLAGTDGARAGAGGEREGGGDAPAKPPLAIDDVATGEAWLACQAPAGLVDELATSHELLRERMARCDVVLVEPAPPRRRSPLAMLTGAVHEAVGAAAALAFPHGAEARPEPVVRDDAYRRVRASG